MNYSFHIPREPLSRFVDRLWMCADEPQHARERILPSGTVELVFNLICDEIRIYEPAQLDRFKRLSGAVASGPYRGCFAIDPSQHAAMVGVHFRPGGAFPFFGAAHELVDVHVDLNNFWGRSAWADNGVGQSTQVKEQNKMVVFRAAAVRYQVKDVARSVEFYTKHLDFKVEMAAGAAFAKVANGPLTLYLSGPQSSGSRPMPDGRKQEPGGWNRLVLEVDDLAACIAELKKRDVRFRNEMESGPGGKQIQVEDPDGNPIELFEPGSPRELASENAS